MKKYLEKLESINLRNIGNASLGAFLANIMHQVPYNLIAPLKKYK
jgi:hypothetical protein